MSAGLPSRWEIQELPSQDPRWALVERIASSSQLQKAPQLRDILLYIAARSLTERPVSISEHQIGSNVLGRGADFDPNQDNIVRARMRHLRTKLEEYFSGEGRDEPLVLTIPKGCYVARFEPRPVAAVAADAAKPEPGGSPPEPVAEPTTVRPSRLKNLAFVAVVLGVAGAFFLWGRHSGTPVRPAASSPGLRAEYGFYQDLLGPLGREPASDTRLVLSNPKVMVLVGSPSVHWSEGGSAVAVPPALTSELVPAANPRDEGLPYHFIRITDQDYTGLGEAASCFYLGQLIQTLGRHLRLTQARFLNWDSVKTENLIIVGSPDINQWAHQNLPHGNYSIEKLGIRNEKPRRGEPALYSVQRSPQTGKPLVDYGLIWMSNSVSGTRILVLAGCTSPGTAGVGGFSADPNRMRPVYDRLKADGGQRGFPSDWQVLLKVSIRDNLPIETTYVGHHVYSTAP